MNTNLTYLQPVPVPRRPAPPRRWVLRTQRSQVHLKRVHLKQVHLKQGSAAMSVFPWAQEAGYAALLLTVMALAWLA